MGGHSKEPWAYDAPGDSVADIEDDDDLSVFTEHFDGEPSLGEANARRIVACVNACTGISTEALEQGVVAEMRENLRGWYTWATPQPPSMASVIEKTEALLAKLEPSNE